MSFAEIVRDRMNEQNWHQGGMLDSTRTRFCILGHAHIAAGWVVGTPAWIFTVPDAVEEYMELVHKIIAEQFPEAVDGWLMADTPLTIGGLVTWFNDCFADWADIHLIADKAAAHEN